MRLLGLQIVLGKLLRRVRARVGAVLSKRALRLPCARSAPLLPARAPLARGVIGRPFSHIPSPNSRAFAPNRPLRFSRLLQCITSLLSTWLMISLTVSGMSAQENIHHLDFERIGHLSTRVGLFFSSIRQDHSIRCLISIINFLFCIRPVLRVNSTQKSKQLFDGRNLSFIRQIPFRNQGFYFFFV